MKTVFPARLKALRLREGLYQKDLARELNVAQSLIAHWENGRNFPDIFKLTEISYFFNVSADYLLGKIDIPDYGEYEGFRKKELALLKELNGLPGEEIDVLRGIVNEYRRNKNI